MCGKWHSSPADEGRAGTVSPTEMDDPGRDADEGGREADMAGT